MLRVLQGLKDPQELKEGKVHLAPLVSLVRRERLEFPDFLVPLAEMVCRVLVDFLAFLVLKVILEKMVSRVRLDLPDLRDSKEARETLDLLEVLDQEDREERLDP